MYIDCFQIPRSTYKHQKSKVETVMHKALLKLDIVEIICGNLDIRSLSQFYKSCKSIKEAIDELGLWKRRAQKLAGSSPSDDWLLESCPETSCDGYEPEYYKDICITYSKYSKIRTSMKSEETFILPEVRHSVKNCAVSESKLLISSCSESEPVLNLWDLSIKECVPLLFARNLFRHERIWSLDLLNRFAVSGSNNGNPIFSKNIKTNHIISRRNPRFRSRQWGPVLHC